MDELIFSVTELNTYVQRSLAGDPLLAHIKVRGEVSNYKRYASGHCYFTLKDDRSRISCVWFASSQTASERNCLQDGAKVQVIGSAGLYSRDGQYQLVVDHVKAQGVGLWHLQLQETAARLAADGLLDPARKRPIPEYPHCIGVITSAKGAAVRDIISVASRRMPWVHILIYPVQVQGDDAPDQLVRALDYFSRTKAADVVILGRGGGSVEDLWAFNEEKVVRKTADCSVPVISAVGHETDIALTDLVADARAATPSMAAELAAADSAALLRRLYEIRQTMDMAAKRCISVRQQDWERKKRLLNLLSPDQMFRREIFRVHETKGRLMLQMQTKLQKEETRIRRTAMTLQALSPARVLDRGYAMARTGDGRVIGSYKDISEGEEFILYLSEGSLKAKVLEKSEVGYEKKRKL